MIDRGSTARPSTYSTARDRVVASIIAADREHYGLSPHVPINVAIRSATKGGCPIDLTVSWPSGGYSAINDFFADDAVC